MEMIYGIVVMFSLLWMGMIHSLIPAGPRSHVALILAGALPMLVLLAAAYLWGETLL